MILKLLFILKQHHVINKVFPIKLLFNIFTLTQFQQMLVLIHIT